MILYEALITQQFWIIHCHPSVWKLVWRPGLITSLLDLLELKYIFKSWEHDFAASSGSFLRRCMTQGGWVSQLGTEKREAHCIVNYHEISLITLIWTCLQYADRWLFRVITICSGKIDFLCRPCISLSLRSNIFCSDLGPAVSTKEEISNLYASQILLSFETKRASQGYARSLPCNLEVEIKNGTRQRSSKILDKYIYILGLIGVRDPTELDVYTTDIHSC